MPHKVLIITYLFPPSGGIGPPRYVAYARRLTELGFEVHVLTAKKPNTPLYDPGLLKKVPKESTIHRVFNPDLPYDFRDRLWKRITGEGIAAADPATARSAGLKNAVKRVLREAIQRFFNPDVQKFWVPFVIRAARRIIREHGIGTVILNTPPFSLYGVVEPLKREFPHVNWITEVRDDWLGYYFVNFDSARTDAKLRLAVRLEASGMRSSDYVVAVTPAQRDSIRNRYPDQAEGKFLMVTNGFDEDLFKDFRPQRGDRRGMVVGYFGSLYASPPYHPGAYLRAVETLPEGIREQVETRLIGRIAREVEPVLAGSSAKLSRLGFLPREEGIKQLEQCDYLLLIANEPSTHAGKLFDYLASGLPILALTTPGGEVARIIQETRAGVAVDGSSPEAIRTLLLAAWERLQGAPSPFPEPDRAAVMTYDRRRLVDRLVALTHLGGDKPATSG